MNNATMSAITSSANDSWATPPEILDAVYTFSRVGLDPCAAKHSPVVASKFINWPEDGLAADWASMTPSGCVFVNPPYGRAVKNWVAKCAYEGAKVPVVGLVAARTDTTWFHDNVFKKARCVCFLRGRVSFLDQAGNACNPAPFPSAMVLWAPEETAGGLWETKFHAAMKDLGVTISLR